MAVEIDKELQEYRDLLPQPETFEEGFGWRTVAGAIFIGFVMMPGSMYLNLVMGGTLGPVARWVTIILFLEAAKRSLKTLKQQEVYVLYYMAGMALASPFSGLLWRQYLVRSEPAQMFGIVKDVPLWVAPATEELARTGRTFLTRAWLAPIALIVLGRLIARVDHFGLGYVLYRLTSDVERLPFPMAAVGAAGAMALAESTRKKQTWRWTCFSVGAVIGLVFGLVYIALPAVTGALFGTPVMLLPIPFVDCTQYTEGWLPAVAVVISFNLGAVIVGMVLPFWAIIGGVVGVIVTFAANPTLLKLGILHRWRPGMDFIATSFNNRFDFYLSFGIGLALAVAGIGFGKIFQTWWRERGKTADRDQGIWRVLVKGNPARGDISIWLALGIYVFSTCSYIVLCKYLVPDFPIWFFVGYGFVYTPIISYATARMEGLAGQVVTIPMVREATFILSGIKGTAIWFAPIPIHNYGVATVGFRQIELTGTNLRSIIKTEVVVFPIVMVASIIFSELLWRMAEVPSPSYPFAQKMWHLRALNSCLLYSSTASGYSPFMEALRFRYMGIGLGMGLATYVVLSGLGLPTLLVYGVVRGLNQSMPTVVFLELIGALLGRYYFARKFGRKQWRQFAPVILAGFSCGMGLVGMGSVAVVLILKSVAFAPL